MLAVDLTVYSDHLALTFKEVVEHICQIVFSEGRRKKYANEVLESLLSLVKRTGTRFVGAAWINDLLKRAAWKKMGDTTFAILLGLSALRKTDEAEIGQETTAGHDFGHLERNGADPGGIVASENSTPEYALLDQVLRIVDIYGTRDDWEDDVVYGGLIAIKDLPGARLCDLKEEFIRTLSKAMEKRETEGEVEKDKPFRIRTAAYDVVLAVRDRWLRSADLRPILEAVDFPRKLHSVAIEIARHDYQHPFLEMMEILSEDRYWHSYLRKAMDIWLPLHHEERACVLRILCSVGGLLLPGSDGYSTGKPLEKVMEEEWKSVPGRSDPKDLTADRLGPLAEVTEQFKRLSFFSESDRKAVLAAVEQVVSSLERRRDKGYGGPDDVLRRTIEDLLRVLRDPVQAGSRRATFW